MILSLKAIAKQKWFVPLIIIILVAIVLSSISDINHDGEDASVLTDEKRLEEMCNAISGVSNAKVMISYTAETASLFEKEKKKLAIDGIAIICEGGSNPNIQLTLYNMIEALFDLPSTRITISERKAQPLS